MGNCLNVCLAPTEEHDVKRSLNPAGSHCEQIPPVDKSIRLQGSLLGRQQPQDVTDFYELGRVIGSGLFGCIRLAVEKATERQYACKSINKSRLLGSEEVADVKQELQIMHYLSGHPHIIHIKEALEDHVYVHLIMELCTGGDLVDRIMAKGRYTERDAAAVIRTVLEVAAYCHEMGVVHRDLKPDNFLLADPSDDANLKATDFGMSVFLKPGQRLSRECGTAFYMAPEVLMKDYDQSADVWAVGVILYILLCGTPPFEDQDDDVIFRMIVEDGKPDFSSYLWDNITEPAKDCVRLMMTYDPKHRPSAREMLAHEWIREGGVAGDNPIEPEVLHRMRSFAAMNKLKKQALLFIGERLSPDEIRGLHELFEAIDTDGSGTISLAELKQAISSRGSAVSEEELQQLIDLADVDHNHEIDWKEFIGATMHVSKLQQEHHLIAAFKHFDTDNSGYLTRDELAEALRSSALDELQLQGDIDKVLQECDTNGDGRIDYGEFCLMMLPSEVEPPRAALFADNWAAQQARITREAAATATKAQQQQQGDEDDVRPHADQAAGLTVPTATAGQAIAVA